MPDGPEQQCGARQQKEYPMKRKSTLQLIVILLAVMIALFSFTACDDNPNAPPETGQNPEDNPPAISDEEALTGQWFVYWLGDETQEMEYSGLVIDIQYTKPGYWIMASLPDISGSVAFSRGSILSNRILNEDGWFVVSVSEAEGGYEIRYRFRDSDRNTLEAESGPLDDVDKMELKRVVGRVIEIKEGKPK